MALSAFVASRTASRPGAMGFFAKLEGAGLVPPGALIAAYDRRTEWATKRLGDQLNNTGWEHLEAQVDATLDKAKLAAEKAWTRFYDCASGAPGAAPSAGTSGQPENPEEEDADREELEAMTENPVPGAIQARLSSVMDKAKLGRLLQNMEERDMFDDVLRLRELEDSRVQDHSWVEAISPGEGRHHGPSRMDDGGPPQARS